MAQALIVGIGGFIGSILRYWLSEVAQRWVQDTFPAGTLFVNVIGCFVIGVVWSVVEYGGWFRPETRLFIVTGILGGFTTFSAFGVETIYLVRRGEVAVAALYVGLSLVVGLAGLWLGMNAVPHKLHR